MKKKQRLYLPVKRMLDLIISLVSLVLLSPLFIIISLIIKVDSTGPVLFKQKRVGLNNKYFYILKFRTMSIEAPSDKPTDKLSDPNTWITKTGVFLRKSSLDELPQLINIFLGQMSIVGPRPALWNQSNLNKLRLDANIHTIKPGLTGLAQINGRDENSDVQKIFYDKKYLDSFSLMVDIKCVFSTVYSVINSKGVLEGGSN